MHMQKLLSSSLPTGISTWHLSQWNNSPRCSSFVEDAKFLDVRHKKEKKRWEGGGGTKYKLLLFFNIMKSRARLLYFIV